MYVVLSDKTQLTLLLWSINNKLIMAFNAIIIVIHYKYDNKKKMNSQNGALGNNDELTYTCIELWYH